MCLRRLAATIFLGVLLFFPPLTWAYSSPGKPVGFVNDFAGVLTPEQRQQIEVGLKEYTQKTSNELTVVTITNLGGDTIENYIEKLFKEWGIGKKGKDNGLLFLVSKDDRKIRLEVGYGLESVVTDAGTDKIIRTLVVPAFKNGDYFKGISDGTSAIMKLSMKENFSGDSASTTTVTTEENRSRGRLGNVLPLIFFGLFGLVWFASMLARSKSWWAGGLTGAFFAVIIGRFVSGWPVWLAAAGFVPAGLLFDFLISRAYQNSLSKNSRPPWWAGGSGRSSSWGRDSDDDRGSSSSFGGFGGGSSGGGGASGSW